MKRMAVLRPKNLYFLVGLVIAGLIGVQVYWMVTSVRLQKADAERKLKNDVNAIVKDVVEEAYCFHYYSKAFIKQNEGIYIIKQSSKGDHFIPPPLGYVDTLTLYNVFFDKKDTLFDKENSLTFVHAGATVDISLKFKFAMPSDHVKTIDTTSYSLSNLNVGNYKQALYNRQTIDEIINPDNLDSQIKQTLRKNNFDTVYELGIKRVGNKQFEYLRKGSNPEHLAKSFITVLFAGDNFNSPYELSLYLPDPLSRTIHSMAAVMISSILIIIVLIISYAYFVRTILNQKKLSEMKSMFINNITHEFNTPITNINLAVENWKVAKTNNDFYANIIAEENKHMENNVAQILKLATVETTKIEAYLDKVDINDLMRETARTFEMQLNKTQGALHFKLEAAPLICGDAQLIKNMLYNLVDNAIKYRKDDLHINISTYESNGDIVIEVADNGIGMSAETQKYIFERFYRGDKSDRHDVKGFGLGLSYVKYIIDAHKGSIQVKSKKGSGTTFIVHLPKTVKR